MYTALTSSTDSEDPGFRDGVREPTFPFEAEQTVTRVLVADDHDIFRSGLCMLLATQPEIEVVGQASNGQEAIDLHRAAHPDVTLMDLRMPVLDGVEATSRICAEHPSSRVIILTAFDGDEDVYHAFRAGATGYLLKTSNLPVLLAAIRDAKDGKRCVPPNIAAKLEEHFHTTELTSREIDVLRLTAAGKSNLHIAEELFVATSTVKTHMTSIMEKLGASNRVEAVAIAIRRGLVHLGIAAWLAVLVAASA